jgi:hypothetical protein
MVRLRQHGELLSHLCCIIGGGDGILKDWILIDSDSLVPITINCSELLPTNTGVSILCLAKYKYI